jgi:hypothetical protein
MYYYVLDASELIDDEGHVYDDFSHAFSDYTKIVGMKRFAKDKKTFSWQEIKPTLDRGKYVTGYPVRSALDAITTGPNAVGMWQVNCPIEKVYQVGERWLWQDVKIAPELVEAILKLAERMHAFKGWCLENGRIRVLQHDWVNKRSNDTQPFVSLKLLTDKIVIAYFNFEGLIYSFSLTKRGWQLHPIAGSITEISSLSVTKSHLLLVMKGLLGEIKVLQLNLKNYRPVKLDRAVEKLLLDS